MVTCKKHPQYKGVYRERKGCEECRQVYFANHGIEVEIGPVTGGDREIPKAGVFQRMIQWLMA